MTERPTWSLTQTVAPTVEPVTRAETKDHLRITHIAEDDRIDDLITAARIHAESFTNRQFITATYALRLGSFPTEILCPRPPLQTAPTIAYIDVDGASQPVAASVYQYDIYSTIGRIKLAVGQTWPTTAGEGDYYNPVTVTYQAGYGAAGTNVPRDIRVAIMMIVGQLMEHPEGFADRAVQVVPRAVERLLWPYRVGVFGLGVRND